MASIIETIKKLFAPIEPIPPGVYHYQSPPENPLNYRLHLRMEPQGHGVLIVNASTVLHLNTTATEYAYYFVNQMPPEEAAAAMARRYDVDKEQAKEDYLNLQDQIEILISTPDLDPVTFLDFDRHIPYSQEISAPYRLDCAITYRLPEGTPPQAAPTKRVDRELTTEEWKTIIDKAWEAGIPHILFTGGEPTLREDLIELIEYAEKNGQVTGLITDGIKLGDTKFLNILLQSGLDHTMIVLQPDKKSSWESLSSFSYWSDTLKDDIFVAAHLTITKKNSAKTTELIDKLAEAGVSAVSLSINDKSLSAELHKAREYTNDMELDMVWDIPVPYSNLNPVALELDNEEEEEYISEGAGRGWLYVEPDGDVLPSQGVNIILGNMLNDSWKKIWKPNQQ